MRVARVHPATSSIFYKRRKKIKEREEKRKKKIREIRREERKEEKREKKREKRRDNMREKTMISKERKEDKKKREEKKKKRKRGNGCWKTANSWTINSSSFLIEPAPISRPPPFPLPLKHFLIEEFYVRIKNGLRFSIRWSLTIGSIDENIDLVTRPARWIS